MITINETGCPIIMKIAWMLHQLLLLAIIGIGPARAQDVGTVNPEPLPPLANPNSPPTPARELFCPQNDAVCRTCALDRNV
jgi:hypothetical protein